MVGPVAEANIRVGLDATKAKAGMRGVAKNAEKEFSKVSRILNKIQKDSFRRLTRGLATIFSLHAFTRMVSDAKEFERTMSLISGRIGMTTDRIANMQLAFNRFNKSGQGVGNLLATISKGVSSFSFGKGDFVAKLGAMGINFRTLEGRRKSNEQIMYEISDWTRKQLASGRNEADVRYWLDSFGIDDATFEALKQGSGKMKAIMAEYYKATGGVKTKNTSKLRKQLDELSGNWDVLKKKVEDTIAPALTKVASALSGFTEFANQHSEIVSIITGIIGLLTALSTMKWVVGIITGLAGAKKALIALAGLKAGAVATGIGATSAAAAGAASGLGLLTSALVALGGAASLALGGVTGWYAGGWVGDKLGDLWSKWFGSGDNTTEEFWDNAVKEKKISFENAELGKRMFVKGYKEKNDITTEGYWDRQVEIGNIPQETANLYKMTYVKEYREKYGKKQPNNYNPNVPVNIGNKPKLEKENKTKNGILINDEGELANSVDSSAYGNGEPSLEAANLEQAEFDGIANFTNDIDVEVNVDKNGGVTTNINANGQTNTGQQNRVSFIKRTAS